MTYINIRLKTLIQYKYHKSVFSGLGSFRPDCQPFTRSVHTLVSVYGVEQLSQWRLLRLGLISGLTAITTITYARHKN